MTDLRPFVWHLRAGHVPGGHGLAWLALWAALGCAPSTPAEAPSSHAGSEGAAAAVSEGAEPTASPANGEAPASAAATGTSAGPAPIDLDGDDGLDADIAELSRSTKAGADATAGTDSRAGDTSGASSKGETSELEGREVVYRVTPQGLVIEVDGIHFRPEAKAFREARGTYGVQLTLSAESFDDRQYWLSVPEEGPLCIAGRIEGSAGKRQRFSDERRGDAEEVVRSGDPRKFRQRWPGKGQPPLRAGQTLTLEVGLWGIHADGERERPVRRLFEVKLAAARPPQAVISPPTMDWGN